MTATIQATALGRPHIGEAFVKQETIQKVKAECIRPEESTILSTTRNITEAKRLLELKNARENAVETILDLGQDVSLQDVYNEGKSFGNDTFLVRISDYLGNPSPPENVPLEEGLYLTQSPGDVASLILLAARAAIRPYRELRNIEGEGKECYLPSKQNNSSENYISLTHRSYDLLIADLHGLREELAEIKKEAGII